MKILFVLGFPNPFPGAAWTRIGFFAKDWSKKGHSVEVLGTFSYKTLRKRGVKRIGRINIFNLVFNMGLSHPLIFTLNSIISFIVSTFFLLVKKPNVAVVSVPSGDAGLGALMACKLLKAKCMHVLEKPVIATSVGGIPEVVEDGINGILIPPRSPEHVAKALELLLTNSALRRKLGKAAAESVKDYTWSKIAKKYEKIYESKVSFS